MSNRIAIELFFDNSPTVKGVVEEDEQYILVHRKVLFLFGSL